MLTGDKFETAENIAASCKLIDLSDPLLYIIRLRNKTDCEILHKPDVLKELYADIESGKIICCLIIESQAMSCIFLDYFETA